MPSLGTLALFLPAAALVAISPGANNLLALRNGVRGGARRAIAALAGRMLAFATMVGLVAGGLASVLAHSQTVFAALKWAGVAYLAYLGVRALAGGTLEAQDGRSRGGHVAMARQEFLVAAANPKALLLFTAFVPQFVDASHAAAPQLLVLGALYIAVELAAASLWATTGARLGAAGLSRRARRRVERGSGMVFLGLAGLLARAE